MLLVSSSVDWSSSSGLSESDKGTATWGTLNVVGLALVVEFELNQVSACQ